MAVFAMPLKIQCNSVALLMVVGLVSLAHAETTLEDVQIQERMALEAVYFATNGPLWTRATGWLTSEPVEDWYGVVVRNGRVVGLRLMENELSGQIPSEIKHLPQLEFLDFRWNSLKGELPNSLFDLSKLQVLLLKGNGLSGAVSPKIGQLTELNRLDLSHNQFSGEIPNELGQLGRLRGLGLHHNNLSGVIPEELAKISGLRKLFLSDNRLIGQIPEGMQSLSELSHLNLARNFLIGDVPEYFSRTASLKFLDLRDNLLVERAPSEWSVAEFAAMEFSERSIRSARLQESSSEGFGTKTVEEQRFFRGSDVLNETTAVFRDSNLRTQVFAGMDAIHYRDGVFHVQESSLPPSVDVAILDRIISSINNDSKEHGNIVATANDLERVLIGLGSRYAHDMRRIQEAGNPISLLNTGSSGLGQAGSSSEVHISSGTVSPLDEGLYPVVACDLSVQLPHKSRYENGYIKTKTGGSCWVVTGPTNVAYDLTVELKGLIFVFSIFPMWYTFDSNSYPHPTGHQASWIANHTDAKVHCDATTNWWLWCTTNLYLGVAKLRVTNQAGVSYLPYPSV